jgi:hypothetical protein
MHELPFCKKCHPIICECGNQFIELKQAADELH